MMMMAKNTATLCILGLLIVFGDGCKKSSGSRNFSYNFNGEKTEALVTAATMYDTLCRELESRGFTKRNATEDPQLKRIHYDGEYDGFPLTVESHSLLSISEEKPEFYYRVSFKEANAVGELDKAAKTLRALMKEWCDHAK